MQPNQIEELFRELDATDERYVRRRHAMNGYAGWKAKHVKTWIDAKDRARKDRQAFGMQICAAVSALAAIGSVIAPFLRH